MSKDPVSMLSFILGNQSVLMTKQQKSMQKVNRKLIINSAMFWDSKKRVQKIKTLFMNSIGLKQFDDVEDFKVQELESIELLSLSKNQIIHLQPIGQLTTLVSLNVSFNKVYDLNPLTKLQKLQELYASNNEIKTIQPLDKLQNIRTLQLYNNKIHNFKETFQTLTNLNQLTELDIESNPVAEDHDFLEVISSSIPALKKFNGQLNKTSQKIKELSSSKGFMNNTSMKGFATTSVFFSSSPSSPSLFDPEKSFYNFCKKKSSTSQTWQKRKEKQNILQKLETHYKQLDQDFQKEIVKNVKLKNRLYKIIENKRNLQNEKQDKSTKNEQVKQLKRKVKALKEQLFTKDIKGDLLKKLFQIEVTYKGRQSEESKGQNVSLNNDETKSKAEKLEQAENQIKWTRRFQADDVIVIQTNEKYLEDDMEQMNQLLGNIDNSIMQLKRDLDYLS